MVLQQQQVVPIWGQAKAGGRVSVKFLTQIISTKVDEYGHWKVELSPLIASYTPAFLTVEGKANTIGSSGTAVKEKLTINNILVGEVWLSSGQSNMLFTLAESLSGQKDIAQANNINLRLLDFTNQTLYPDKKVFNVKALGD
jgi:sialate O-acetylesterase